MSTSETESTTTARTMPSPVPAPRRASAELATEHGRTSISDVVVAKIVAIATREVDGVYTMGTGSARMIGAVRQRVPGTRASETQGVAVEVGERQAAADLDLVVEYGVSIPDVAAAVRANVIARWGASAASMSPKSTSASTTSIFRVMMKPTRPLRGSNDRTRRPTTG